MDVSQTQSRFESKTAYLGRACDCPSCEMLLDLFYCTRRKLAAAVQLDF